MAKRGFRFQANLVPTTPSSALELHRAIRTEPTPVDNVHGHWWPIDDISGAFGTGNGVASVVGSIPSDGGDLLVYLKHLRRIVEAPVDPEKPRIDEALRRAKAIREISPLRTYSFGEDFKLRPNATLEDFGAKIFKRPNALLDFVLNVAYGIGYKQLDKTEKARARENGCAGLSDTLGRTLASQCEALGWPHSKLLASKTGRSTWCSPTGTKGSPEAVALEIVRRPGERGSFCEGDSVKVLMKAACFDFLVKHNIFQDPADAARSYFEAQCTILVDRRSEIVNAIRESTTDAIASSLRQILATSPTGVQERPLSAAFMMELYSHLGAGGLAAIAEVFVRWPYDYRSGWPDLTLVGNCGLRFVEVKTTDRFHDAQVRFAQEIAAPLGLRCEVAQLLSSSGH